MGIPGKHALAGVLVYRFIDFWLVMIIGWAVMGLLVRRSRQREAGKP